MSQPLSSEKNGECEPFQPGGDSFAVPEIKEGKEEEDAEEVEEASGDLLSAFLKKPLAGHVFILLSCLTQTVTAVIVKILKRVDPFLLMAWRAMVIVVLTAPVVLWRCKAEKARNDKRSDGGERGGGGSGGSPFSVSYGRLALLLLVGFFMSTGDCLGFYAVRNMPLGDYRMIAASLPVFVGVFGKLFLREACGIFQSVTMSLTLVGVFIVMKPPFVLDLLGLSELQEAQGDGLETHFGVAMLALAATVLHSFEVVTIRALKGMDAIVITMSCSCVGVWIGLSASGLFGTLEAPSASDAGIMTLAGLASALGILFLVMALKADDATAMSLARKSEDILVSMLVQVLYFGEIPTALTLFGAALILACILLLGCRKVAESRKDSGRCVRGFFCLPEPVREAEF